MEKVRIYHINDIHSHLENWPTISAFLQSERKAYEDKADTLFVFDLGDAVDRVHPLMEATNGQAMTRLLNEAKIDAATIGNNEGLGSSKETLNHLYDEASFPVIVSNLKAIDHDKIPSWAIPLKIMHTKQKQNILIFAVTVPLNVSYQPLGWHAENPFETVERVVTTYKQFADTIILLSHVGIEFDREIAERHPEINLVIGSHTHHVLPKGEKVGDTLLVAAGKFGAYIGEVTLEMDEGRVHSSTAKVIPVESLEKPSNAKNQAEQYEMIGHQILAEKNVANIPITLNTQWFECDSFMEVGLQAIMDYTKTDGAMLNAGLFLRPLLSGIVTKHDLHQTMPHPMRIASVTLKGKDLLVFLDQVDEKQTHLQSREGIGIGFRGKVFGKCCFSGMTYQTNEEKWTWNGESIELTKDYTFATVDHFIFANHFPILQKKGDYTIHFPDFLREIVGTYLKKKYPIASN